MDSYIHLAEHPVDEALGCMVPVAIFVSLAIGAILGIANLILTYI